MIDPEELTEGMLVSAGIQVAFLQAAVIYAISEGRWKDAEWCATMANELKRVLLVNRKGGRGWKKS